jgi:hypothetical protein
MPAAPRLNLIQKQAIIAEYMLNLPYVQIAKKVGVSFASVCRVVQQYKILAANHPDQQLSANIEQYKLELKKQSIGMLKTALTQTKSQDLAIRAAPTAIAVLKGIGEFDNGEKSTGITINIAMPANLPMPPGITIDVSPEETNGSK